MKLKILLTKTKKPISRFVRFFSKFVSHVVLLFWDANFKMWFVIESDWKTGVRLIPFIDWVAEKERTIYLRSFSRPLTTKEVNTLYNRLPFLIGKKYNDLKELFHKGLAAKIKQWTKCLLFFKEDNRDLDCSETVSFIVEILGMKEVNSSAIMPEDFMPGGAFDDLLEPGMVEVKNNVITSFVAETREPGGIKENEVF